MSDSLPNKQDLLNTSLSFAKALRRDDHIVHLVKNISSFTIKQLDEPRLANLYGRHHERVTNIEVTIKFKLWWTRRVTQRYLLTESLDANGFHYSYHHVTTVPSSRHETEIRRLANYLVDRVLSHSDAWYLDFKHWI